jgi:hypothetical protein
VSSRPIQPVIDAYGTYARASCLADYLELLALHGLAPAESELADLIRDQGWATKLDELFTEPPPPPREEFDDEDDLPPGSPSEDVGVPQAGRVFDVLSERAEILAELYPFELTTRLALRAGFDLTESPYVSLLAITSAHAHQVEVKPAGAVKAIDPKQAVEAVVVRTLETLELRCANVGEAARTEADFRATVTKVGQAVGLAPTPDAAVSLVNANEEGVDALAHLASTDARAGHWVLIGQVTCAKSDAWKRKLGEPSGPDWKAYLNVLVEPQGFLAVPHHVEGRQLTKLVHGGNRMVLDRLRLTRLSPGVSDEERSIIEAVLAVGVESRL